MDFCVCCGAYVPEGRMVCFNCENETSQHNAPPTETSLWMDENTY